MAIPKHKHIWIGYNFVGKKPKPTLIICQICGKTSHPNKHLSKQERKKGCFGKPKIFR